MLIFMENDIKTILQKIEVLDQKFERLEKKVDTGFQEIGETTHGIITMFSERFTKVDERFEEVNEHLEIIDERLESIENMNGRHYKDIDDLQHRTDLLETRVDKLEVV